MGLLSIGFPYLWMALVVPVIVLLFTKRRYSLYLFVLLAAGVPMAKNVFALHFNASFTEAKIPGTIRVMQWNCNGLQGQFPWSGDLIPERFKAVAFIKKYQPDIICTQDFSTTISKYASNNTVLLRDTLGYKYHFFIEHYKTNAPGFHDGIGIAIFSKYPFSDYGALSYPFKKVPESIIWADVLSPQGKIRFATTHLQSMHLSRKPESRLESDLWEDSAIIIHGDVFKKLRHFQPFHATEAVFLRSFLDTCTHSPLVFTADLNSVPSSWVYATVKGKNLKDAFLEKGFGFGKSYHSAQPALRIDYIFHSQQVKPAQTALFNTTFSDHDPVIMDITIQ